VSTEDRLADLERQLEGLEVIMARSARLTGRILRDQELSKATFRQWRQEVEDRIDLLDRAFGAVHVALVDHVDDPEAHSD
jgi:hypothetical protein